jgi:hypothetical protein
MNKHTELERVIEAVERELYCMISKKLSLRVSSSGRAIATWEGQPVLAIQFKDTIMGLCEMDQDLFTMPENEREKIVEKEGVDLKEIIRNELPGLWGYIYE